MLVKANQPDRYAAIHRRFPEPPAAPADHRARVTTRHNGHGRLEWRRLARSTVLRA